MKEYEGVEVQLHSLLTSALDGGEWLLLRLVCFAPGKRTWLLFSRRLVGQRSWFGRVSEQKNPMPQPATEAQIVKPTA